MARLSDKEKDIVRKKIKNNPSKGNREIADELGVPTLCVAGLRRGIEVKERFGQIDEKKRAEVRKLIKLGKSDQQIHVMIEIKYDDIQLIRNRISSKRKILSEPKFIHKTDNNSTEQPLTIEVKNIMKIFKETAYDLFKETDKVDYLLYREKSDAYSGFCPREIEAQHVMSNILSKYKYHHMIESPTVESKTKGFIDLSIFSENRNRLVDIEFKEIISNADNDFPKLAVSPALGSAVYFISNQVNVEYALSKIIFTYNEIYKRVFNEILEEDIHEKWFIFFLVSCKEKRIFGSFFESIKNVDFDILKNKEITI